MQITKELIQNIGKIFEKGLQDEYLSRAIGKIIEHEKEKTFSDVRLLKKDLSQFEREYNISSEEFCSVLKKVNWGIRRVTLSGRPSSRCIKELRSGLRCWKEHPD